MLFDSECRNGMNGKYKHENWYLYHLAGWLKTSLDRLSRLNST